MNDDLQRSASSGQYLVLVYHELRRAERFGATFLPNCTVHRKIQPVLLPIGIDPDNLGAAVNKNTQSDRKAIFLFYLVREEDPLDMVESDLFTGIFARSWLGVQLALK